MLRSEFSAAIVARPSGWLTSTFRMAICRDTHNSTPQLETVSNLVLPGWAVYGQFKFSKAKRNIGKRPQRGEWGAEAVPYRAARDRLKAAPLSRTLPKPDLL